MRYQSAMGRALLVVAAEASADAHAAAVVRAMRARGDHRPIYGIAGPLLRAQGVEAVARTEELSVMGIVAVLEALPRIRRVVARLFQRVREEPPEAVLLLDSPDLNLRLAKRFKKMAIPVIYYIGPTLWAWRPGRAKLIQRYVDKMLVIFPFEQKVYRDLGVEAEFVGNPLMDVDGEAARQRGVELRQELLTGQRRLLVALLPGSRKAEIARCLPQMLFAAQMMSAGDPTLCFAIPLAATLDREWVQDQIRQLTPSLPVSLLSVPARDLLQAADAAAVVSGTATLEAALAGVPTVVVYRLSALAWFFARMLVRIPHWSLINLVAGREVVAERIQGALTASNLAKDLGRLLRDVEYRGAVKRGLTEVSEKMGEGGASQKVAASLAEFLSEEAGAHHSTRRLSK